MSAFKQKCIPLEDFLPILHCTLCTIFLQYLFAFLYINPHLNRSLISPYSFQRRPKLTLESKHFWKSCPASVCIPFNSEDKNLNHISHCNLHNMLKLKICKINIPLSLNSPHKTLKFTCSQSHLLHPSFTTHRLDMILIKTGLVAI